MTGKMKMLARIRHIFQDIQKFHRYFVYRMYHINDNDPDIRVIFLLIFIHFAHVLTFFFLALEFLSFNLYVFSKIELILLMTLFIILHYILFYKPEKWSLRCTRYPADAGKKTAGSRAGCKQVLPSQTSSHCSYINAPKRSRYACTSGSSWTFQFINHTNIHAYRQCSSP